MNHDKRVNLYLQAMLDYWLKKVKEITDIQDDLDVLRFIKQAVQEKLDYMNQEPPEEN